MNEQQHKIWWELHRRVSRGETLSDEDDQVYQAGRAEMEAEESAILNNAADALRPLQERLRELIARNHTLARQESALRQRATELEKQYQALTLRNRIDSPSRN